MAADYAPLVAFLRALPPEHQRARLRVDEVESLIGAPLRPSAWSPRFWAHSATARRHWRAAGFEAVLDPGNRIVCFSRRLQEHERSAARVWGPGRRGARTGSGE